VPASGGGRLRRSAFARTGMIRSGRAPFYHQQT
jgi:hypothetical protein